MASMPGSSDAIADLPLGDFITDSGDMADDLMARDSGAKYCQYTSKETVMAMTIRTIDLRVHMPGELCRNGIHRTPQL